MEITKHARKRMKERCGLPKKAIERKAKLALEYGISHNECTGRLKKYMDWLFLKHCTAGNIKIYGNDVYIYTLTEKLITVIPLPPIYRDAANKIMKRKL